MAIALLCSGLLAKVVSTKEGVVLLGWGIILFINIPAIVGFSFSIDAKQRNRSNPASVWGAIIWNGIILALILLLMLRGMLR